MSMGNVVFRGFGHYQILKRNKQWEWINVISNQTIAKMLPHEINYPMGRRKWNLNETVCGQESGDRTLILSTCEDDQFSCDDATCIPLEQRCDLKYDCIDHSDEYRCNFVVIPEDYRSDLPPRRVNSGNDTILPISMFIDIEFMSVDTTDMTMHLSYKLRMTWFDSRLLFVNMKEIESLNKIPYNIMTKLWAPTVSYVNTDGNHHTKVDLESSMHARKFEGPAYRDNTAASEGLSLNQRFSNHIFYNQ